MLTNLSTCLNAKIHGLKLLFTDRRLGVYKCVMNPKSFDPLKATQLMSRSDYCAVAAIVYAFDWGPDAHIEWIWREINHDYSARLVDGKANTRQFWISLTNALRTVPDIDRRNLDIFNKMKVIIVAIDKVLALPEVSGKASNG